MPHSARAWWSRYRSWPLLLLTLVIATLTESGLAWTIVWVGLGLTVLAAKRLARAMIFTLPTTMVR